MASESWRCDWITEKCEIASALARGEAGGSYSEAVILVCAALSALAAEVWPGHNKIDQARFIELLVRLGPTPNIPMTISVPLLVRHVELTSSKSGAQLLRDTFLPFSATRIVTGPEVDKSEDEVLSIYPDLSAKDIRKFSYAYLLYKEVRSAHAHEYKPGAKADSWSMTMSGGQSVSYVNRLLAAGIPKTSRLIHFPIAWLAKLAIDIAMDIDIHRASLPRLAPASWWIDGAT
ncbi:MAG: hypothetical protein V4500_09095 [Pseudomonadota bacterium]